MIEFTDTIDHEVFYKTEKTIHVDDVIASLEAYKTLIGYAPKAINQLLEVNIKSFEIFVENIESGSLIEKYLLKLSFGSEEELEKWLAKNPMMKKALLALVVAGIAGYGIYLAATAMSSGTNNINITGNNNIVILAASDVSDKTTKEVESAIHSAVETAHKKIAESSIKLLKPIQSDPAGELLLHGKIEDNNPYAQQIKSATLPKEVIQEAPTEYTPPKLIDHKNFQNVKIMLRANDMDKTTSGWAGTIEGIASSRVNIEFFDGINVQDLYGKTELMADVEIEYRFSKPSKKLRPTKIIVLKVH